MLSSVLVGDTFETNNVFRINFQSVTEEEFEYVFGRRNERVLLAVHEITESNIRDIVFGWY